MEKDSAVKYTDEQLEALEKRLTQEYSRAAKEVSEKAAKYFKRFEVKDKQKQADLAAGKITEEQYKTWRYGQMMTGKRWLAMKDTLTADIVNVDKVAAQMMNDTLPAVYAENGNYATYIAETGANMDTSFTLYSKDTVRALAEAEEISLPTAAVNIAKDKKWVANKVNSAILQGVLQGEAIDKIAKRLYNVTDMSRKASVRNARTLVTSAENQGRTDCFKRAENMGIKMEQGWLATLDGRTRHSHRLLDGEWIKVGGTFSNGLKYPGDPSGRPEEIYNCRCTLIGRVNGTSMDLTDLSNRNTTHLQGMSYEEWKNAKAKVAEGKTYKASLKRQEDLIKGDATETAIVIDKKGKVIFSKTEGKTNQVQFDMDELNMMNGATLTHNHPSGTTFSSADVALLTNWKLDAIRATSKTTTFQLSKIANAKVNNNFANDYQKEHDTYKHEKTDKMYRKIEGNLNSGAITFAEYEEKCDRLNSMLDNHNIEWLKKNAKNYGYRYSIIKGKKK